MDKEHKFEQNVFLPFNVVIGITLFFIVELLRSFRTFYGVVVLIFCSQFYFSVVKFCPLVRSLINSIKLLDFCNTLVAPKFKSILTAQKLSSTPSKFYKLWKLNTYHKIIIPFEVSTSFPHFFQLKGKCGNG